VRGQIFDRVWFLLVVGGATVYDATHGIYLAAIAGAILIAWLGRALLVDFRESRKVRLDKQSVAYIVTEEPTKSKIPFTYGIVGVCVAATLVGWIIPGHWYINQGTVGRTEVLVYHEWWRLVTSAFLHANITHLFMNMSFLLYIGREIEKDVGGKALIAIYCSSALAGGLAVVAFGQEHTLGASGAIYGLLGAEFSLGVRAWLNGYPKSGKRITKAVGTVILINLMFSAAVPFISLAAHTGGLAMGIAAALLIGIPPGLAKAWKLTEEFPAEAHFTYDGTTNRLYYYGPARYAVEAGLAQTGELAKSIDEDVVPRYADVSELAADNAYLYCGIGLDHSIPQLAALR
jgi:membrane associated rhomboid family serine protease